MEPAEPKRFDIHLDPHIGLGIRWDAWDYQLCLLIELPFFIIKIGLGRQK